MGRFDNLAAQVVGTRFRNLDTWQKYSERNRRVQVDRADRLNAEARVRILPTNPNPLPPTSEPKLRPSNEALSPGLLMQPHHRDIVMARAALAADSRTATFFNRF